jgi:opacity protein-like surface antigen
MPSPRLLAVALLLPSFGALAQDDVIPFPQSSSASAAAAAPSGDKPFEPKWGVLFNLQNVFQNASVLSAFRGGVGAQYQVSPQLALRATVALSHSSNPAVVSETTTTVNDMVTTTRTMTRPSPTSTFGIGVGADLLARLLTGDLSPYVGGGLFIGYASEATQWTDDVTTMNQVTRANDLDVSFRLGAQGILGVGWRVHPHFMLFAEYALMLGIVNHTSSTTDRRVTGENTNTQVTSKSASTRVFDINTSLAQGASLGVVAFF